METPAANTRDVTVTFDDGTSHRYAGVPQNVTPAQVQERASKDFPKQKLKSIDGGRRISESRSPAGRGRRVKQEGQLPFVDRAVIGGLDNKEEQKAYLSRKYGEDALSEVKGRLYVRMKDGKRVPVTVGIGAQLVSDAPETVLGIAGAAAGAPAGLLGSAAGAAAGGMAGKAIKEATKAATGIARATPKQVVERVGMAGAANVAGELTTGAVKAIPSRLTRGPFPEWMGGQTAKTKAMTERVLAGGARPPAQSTLPTAMRTQRIAIIADGISGRSKSIERANIGYLQDRAKAILDKANIHGNARDETMRRLLASEQDAMAFQDVGREIQRDAQYMLKGSRVGLSRKDEAYLETLNRASKSPEDAYTWLTAPGQTDRIERYIRIMGPNSRSVDIVQSRFLRQLLAGALERTQSGEAKGALGQELSQYTIKQQRLLLPHGMEKDLKILAEEVQFLYPKKEDPGMAQMTIGAILNRGVIRRTMAQGYYSLFRAFLQKPAIIHRLALGFTGDSAQRIAARNGLREMFYFGMQEMAKPNEDPEVSGEYKK